MFYVHVILMVTGFLLMIVGAGTAMVMRRKKWWLKIHKITGIAGTSLMVTAFAAGIIMVSQWGSGHFRIIHAWIGIITIILAILTPSLGMLQFKIKNMTGQLREKHRIAGRATVIMAFITILTGLWVAGIV